MLIVDMYHYELKQQTNTVFTHFFFFSEKMVIKYVGVINIDNILLEGFYCNQIYNCLYMNNLIIS